MLASGSQESKILSLYPYEGSETNEGSTNTTETSSGRQRAEGQGPSVLQGSSNSMELADDQLLLSNMLSNGFRYIFRLVAERRVPETVSKVEKASGLSEIRVKKITSVPPKGRDGKDMGIPGQSSSR